MESRESQQPTQSQQRQPPTVPQSPFPQQAQQQLQAWRGQPGTIPPERMRYRPVTSGDIHLLGRQIRMEQLLLWRNKRAVIFTFMLPIAFLVFLGASNQGAHLSVLGKVSFDTFFVPGILAFSLVSTTYANLAMSIAVQREQGVLKRVRGTPLPPWIFFAGKVGATLVNACMMVVIVLMVGRFGYHVMIRTATLPALVVDLIVGTACWSVLGIAMSIAVTRAEGGSPIVTLPYIVLSFVSGVFYPAQAQPAWLQDVARAFPLEPFARSLEAAFNPGVAAPGFRGVDLLIMLGWLAVGTAISLRFFRWDRQRR
ncbi:MAG: ABC transporter permease [Actinobacteria bacterium]|nr:ABC transporter permease [Actinomycetota bacterium]MCL5447592.1 ABC transporter permease [Actinomycetota bacterium]